MKTHSFKGTGKLHFLILSGVHGDELTSMYSAASFMTHAQPDKLSRHYASLTIVTGINETGISKDIRNQAELSSPDINRSFVTENYTDVNAITELIDAHDVIIDMHSSPSCTEFVLIDVDEYANSMHQWCKDALLLPVFRYSSNDTIKTYCLQQGKDAMTIELNGMQNIGFDSADRGVGMLASLIKNHAGTDSLYNLIEEPNEDIVPATELKSHASGFLQMVRHAGHVVSKGDTIAAVHDIHSLDVIATLKAPCRCTIVCNPSSDYVHKGDSYLYIQPI